EGLPMATLSGANEAASRRWGTTFSSTGRGARTGGTRGTAKRLVSLVTRATPRIAREPGAACATWIALAVCLLGCTSSDGSSSDNPLGGDSGPNATSGDGGPGAGDRSTACAGRCGQVNGGHGVLFDCGGCASGQTCGGGGPNVCGTGACTPSCADKA